MTKMMKRHMCLLLAVVMVCVLLPLNGSAQAAPAPQAEETEAIPQRGVYEVTALREENVKHFALPDGTYQAVVYGEPIHEMDENGQWQEIDNSLYLGNARGTELYADEKGNTAFAKSFAFNKSVFSISNGGYGISMSVAPNTLSTQTMATADTAPEAQVTNAASRRSTTYSTVEEAAEVDRSSTVRYANVLPGVDLKYTARNRNVEESIVVKTKADSYSYRFALDLDGLHAQQEADGSISLLDSSTNEREYVIPTGLMYDANETVSCDVAYTLTEDRGHYYLTVTADEEWINAPERTMPIVIDSGVVNSGYILDTYVSSAYEYNPHSYASVLWLSRSPSSVGDSEALIQSALEGLPSNATILDAYMRAYYYYNDNVTSGTFNIGVYPIYSRWSAYTATWYNTRSLSVSDSWIYIASTDGYSNATVNSPKAINVPMTSLVQGWANNTIPNCGVKLKYEYGSNLSVCLHSSESGSTYSPRFYVTYEINRLPDGVYTLTSAGNANMAYCGSHEVDRIVQQVAPTTFPNEKHMFKFSYLDTVNGEDYYAIRPMMNNALGLSAPIAGGEVSAVTVSSTNSLNSFPASQRWAVSYVDGFYHIRNGTSSAGSYLSVPSVTITPDDNNALVTNTAATAASKWALDNQDVEINKVVFTDSSYGVAVGSVKEIPAVVQSSLRDVNGPVQYTVENGTGSAEINSATGALSALSYGKVRVGVTCAGVDQTTWVTVYLYKPTIRNSVLKVQCFYDNGYSERFSNYRDRIFQEMEALRDHYFLHYGAYIDFGDLTPVTSYADSCAENGSDYNEFCECDETPCTNHGEEKQNVGSNEETGESNESSGEEIEETNETFLHHKNIYNILYDFATVESTYMYKIAFVGHVTCYVRPDQVQGFDHKLDMQIAGVANKGLKSACVADRIDNDIDHEAYVLIHEFGHLLGVQDHYNHTPDCMYGSSWNQYALNNDYTLCESCQDTINDFFGISLSN